jgi:hypothetical protein
VSFGNESFVLLEWEGEATAGCVSSLSGVSATVELRYDFASDNTAELCLEALTVLIEASEGCCPSHGDDVYTARATDMIRKIFEADCDVYFVFNDRGNIGMEGRDFFPAPGI